MTQPHWRDRCGGGTIGLRPPFHSLFYNRRLRKKPASARSQSWIRCPRIAPRDANEDLKLSFLDSRPSRHWRAKRIPRFSSQLHLVAPRAFCGPTVRDSRRVEYLDTHLKTPVAVISIHIFQKTVRGLSATAAKLATELCSVDAPAAPRSSSDKLRFGQSSGPWQKRCRRSSPHASTCPPASTCPRASACRPSAVNGTGSLIVRWIAGLARIRSREFRMIPL